MTLSRVGTNPAWYSGRRSRSSSWVRVPRRRTRPPRPSRAIRASSAAAAGPLPYRSSSISSPARRAAATASTARSSPYMSVSVPWYTRRSGGPASRAEFRGVGEVVDDLDPLSRPRFAGAKRRRDRAVDGDGDVRLPPRPALEGARDTLDDRARGAAESGAGEFGKDLVQVQDRAGPAAEGRPHAADQEVRQGVHVHHAGVAEPGIAPEERMNPEDEVRIFQHVLRQRSSAAAAGQPHHQNPASVTDGPRVASVLKDDDRHPAARLGGDHRFPAGPGIVGERRVGDVHDVERPAGWGQRDPRAERGGTPGRAKAGAAGQ